MSRGLERVTGIEPALSAWEADVLPLNYTRTPPELSPRRAEGILPPEVGPDLLLRPPRPAGLLVRLSH